MVAWSTTTTLSVAALDLVCATSESSVEPAFDCASVVVFKLSILMFWVENGRFVELEEKLELGISSEDGIMSLRLRCT